ncbi:MAG: PorV/PorQ family protein [Candidatus Krumholzibacteriia bacterium]
MVKTRFTAACATALLLSLALAGAAGAQSEILSLYGGENRGSAGAQFLRLPVGARAIGLGQAYTASSTDGSALFWNPAGVMRTPARRNFFLSHSVYAAGIGLDHVSLNWRGQSFGYGVMAGMLRSGEIPRTTELHQEGTGQTFRADQYFLGVTLGRAMTDRFSIAGTAKFYQENLDDFEVRSLLMDLGILYYVGYGDLRIGFAVHNFGPDLKPGGTPPALPAGYQQADQFQSFPAPTSGSFGVAHTLTLAERVGLLLAADFNHPSDYSESFRLGGELGLDDRLFVRAGFETNRDEGGFAAGFGVKTGTDGFDLRLDYAIRDMGSFGTMHYVSLDLAPLFGRKPR